MNDDEQLQCSAIYITHGEGTKATQTRSSRATLKAPSQGWAPFQGHPSSLHATPIGLSCSLLLHLANHLTLLGFCAADYLLPQLT